MNCPKVVAFYLPQYYETEHNNKWWGNGYTDWVAVKNAEALYKNHYQPRIPLNNNYYNLLDKSVIEEQSCLANKYGVDGFAFYHYYFGNNRLELEQPLENLLKWKDIDIPFCLCWANQSWIRTWSKISGNVWGEKFEKGMEHSEDGVLIKQQYGDVEEWKRHFQYLLPFFRDKRYICIDNHPVFIIYNPDSISCIADMVECWRKMAKQYGIGDVYIVGYNTYSNLRGFNALAMMEPNFSINKMNQSGKVEVRNGVRCIDYDDFWKNTIATEPPKEEKTFFTGACGFDNTPRRGDRGECIENASPEKFEKYFTELLIKSLMYNNELVFVNAWNEWGEGMYLEPDEVYKYRYLEAIYNSKNTILCMDSEKAYSIKSSMEQYGKRENQQEYLLEKYKMLYRTCSKWLDIIAKNDVSMFSGFFRIKGIRKVAIYGFAEIGHKLLYQLRKEQIDVLYAVDQYVGSITDDFPVYRPEDLLPVVDIMIITAYDPSIIKKSMKSKASFRMASLLEMLEEIDDNTISNCMEE